MRMRTMLATSVVGATLLLAMVVGSATARNFSVSNRSIRTTWTELEFSGGFVTIRCAATLEGSFHSASIRKTAGALVGYVSRAVIHRPCGGGTAWFFGDESNEVLGGRFTGSLPWHYTYEGFAGVLPTPVSITLGLTGMRFEIRALVSGFLILCEYLTGAGNGGSLSGTLNLNAAPGTVSNFRFDETRRITSGSGGLCPEVSVGGAGQVRLQGTTVVITVRLI